MNAGRWSVWLPVAIAFGTAMVVAGFGLAGVMSSPGAVLYALIFVLIGLIPGAIVGGIAVAATRLADRAMQKAGQSGRLSVALVHAAAAGIAVGLVVWAYMSVTAPGVDPSSIVALLAVSLVAAVSAAHASMKVSLSQRNSGVGMNR